MSSTKEIILLKLETMRIEHSAKADMMHTFYGKEADEELRKAYRFAALSVIDQIKDFIDRLEIFSNLRK